MAAKRIEVEEENRKAVQEKRIIAADSLQKFQLQILELDNNTEVAGELGPLQYLSGLTGTPMDKIINILLLVIIFVFDPLAIALVVAANFAFDRAYRREDVFIDEDEEAWKDFVQEETYNAEKSELDKTMDNIISPEVKKKYEDIPIKVAGEEEQYKEGGLLKNTQRTLMTGYQLEDNIYRVSHKGPSMWKVELKTGEVVLVHMKNYKNI